MNDNDIEQIFKRITEESIKVATNLGKKYKKAAEEDVKQLIDDIEENLKQWTIQLSEGKLSKQDFEFLIMGQKELAEMHALKQKGLALIKVDELKNSIITIIFNTVHNSI